MEVKTHTEGPWEVSYLDKNGQRVVKGKHIEICTCWHHSVKGIEAEMELNAALIAAAPEILSALKPFANYACDNWSECSCHNCEAKKAVIKAEKNNKR